MSGSSHRGTYSRVAEQNARPTGSMSEHRARTFYVRGSGSGTFAEMDERGQ